MKYVVLTLIQIYWLIIPESKRKNCLHCESCSRFVYRKTESNGLKSGLWAFCNRYRSCRPGYEVIKLEPENRVLMKLVTGEILQEEEISKNIMDRYK